MPVYIVLDVETVALADAALWLEPIKVPGNYKKPESIAAYIAEAEQERLDKLALDPDCNRMVALGYHVIGRTEPCCTTMADETAEAAMLIAFSDTFKTLNRNAEVKLVTFNGFKFDLPVLMRRAMYLDVEFPLLSLDRYRTPHIDLWQRLSYNGTISAHSLQFYAKRMGFTTLDKVNGSDIGSLVAAGKWDDVQAHCLSDVALTHAVANRLGLLRL